MGTEKKEEEGKQKAEDKRNEEGFVGEELEEYEDPLPLQEAIEEYIMGETRTAIGAGSPILASFYTEDKSANTKNIAKETMYDEKSANERAQETKPDVEKQRDMETTRDLKKRDEKLNKKESSSGIKGVFHKIVSWFKGDAKEEMDLTDLPDGIKDCADTLNRMLKEVKRSPVQIPLREADGWIKDLIRYLKQPMYYEDEDVFQAEVMTVMSLFGYVENGLRMAMDACQQQIDKNPKKGAKWRNIMADLQTQLQSFVPFKERVPGYADNVRDHLMASNDARASGENQKNPTICMLDIVKGAEGDIKVFRINDQTQKMGAQASELLKVEEDGKNYYFKKDEAISNWRTDAIALLPLLEDSVLEQKLKKYMEGISEQQKHVFVENNDYFGFLNEDDTRDQFKIDNLKGMMDKSTWQEIERYIATDKRANWKKFVKEFQRIMTIADVTKGENLRLDEKANLTARNFASERVAELLNLSELIVHNSEAYVEDENGERRKGFVMDQAKGIDMENIVNLAVEKDYEVHFTEAAQKQLLNLQLLDNITGQIDRHRGNYFADYDETYDEKGRKYLLIKSVVGIDNDFAFGKADEISESSNTSSVLRKVVNQRPMRILGGEQKEPVKKDKKHKKHNKVNEEPPKNQYQYMPEMIDQKMYESLMTLTPELLAINLENVIEPEYLEPLKKRYQIVRDSVLRAKKEADEKKIDFFRNKTKEWDRQAEQQLIKNVMPSHLSRIDWSIKFRKLKKK